uniref:Zinc finger, CCHC-type n=1 Tax=Tanacetum cinerariifolium TaxID=118510 RepID=A0A6L2LTW8_TANCI|nr:zinc finger, CCHC-type [Tanacetum cinerariifolium]
MTTTNSRELMKITKGTTKETGDRLYVRGMSDHPSKAHSSESLWCKLRGGIGKRKCFVCHLEGHMKRASPIKKSSGFARKGKHDQNFDFSDDEGKTYFGEALMVLWNDEITKLVMDSGGSYCMTPKRDFLYDFMVVDGGLIQLGVHGVQVDKCVWFEVELHIAQRNHEAACF